MHGEPTFNATDDQDGAIAMKSGYTWLNVLCLPCMIRLGHVLLTIAAAWTMFVDIECQ